MLVDTKLPKLGVGINYHWDFKSLISENLDAIDYIEVSPDILCEERLVAGQRQFCMDDNKLKGVLALGDVAPVVVHGLGLSIGSASGWNNDYLNLLSEYAKYQEFFWHSEHLGFTLIKNADGSEAHAGVLLPMPFTSDALDVLCPRINSLCHRFDVPFLIENTTYYIPNFAQSNVDPSIPLGNTEWDEIEFLNQLLNRSQCGLLLDLYNFYCNAINFGFDPYIALSRLQLDRVVEVHVAGGVTHEGFLLDVHSSEVPEPVWLLLEWILPKLPNLRAITYELLEQALPLMGEDKILEQLHRCKKLWRQYIQGANTGADQFLACAHKEGEYVTS